MKLVEQMIPALLYGWRTNGKQRSTKKVVWRRQRGCEIVPIPCIPCTYSGQLLGSDCVTQTLSCDIELANPQQTLINSINTMVSGEGFNVSNCDLNSLTSKWYVDIKLNGTQLGQDLFFEGFEAGITDKSGMVRRSLTTTTWHKKV